MFLVSRLRCRSLHRATAVLRCEAGGESSDPSRLGSPFATGLAANGPQGAFKELVKYHEWCKEKPLDFDASTKLTEHILHNNYALALPNVFGKYRTDLRDKLSELVNPRDGLFGMQTTVALFGEGVLSSAEPLTHLVIEPPMDLWRRLRQTVDDSSAPLTHIGVFSSMPKLVASVCLPAGFGKGGEAGGASQRADSLLPQSEDAPADDAEASDQQQPNNAESMPQPTPLPFVHPLSLYSVKIDMPHYYCLHAFAPESVASVTFPAPMAYPMRPHKRSVTADALSVYHQQLVIGGDLLILVKDGKEQQQCREAVTRSQVSGLEWIVRSGVGANGPNGWLKSRLPGLESFDSLVQNPALVGSDASFFIHLTKAAATPAQTIRQNAMLSYTRKTK